MKEYIKLNLQSPMQSWGNAKMPLNKYTATIPTLSGICGLIGNALGFKNSSKQDRDLLDVIRKNVEVYLDVKCSNLEELEIVENFHKAKLEKYKCGDGKIDPKGLPIVTKEMIIGAKYVLYIHICDNDTTMKLGYCIKNPNRVLYLGRKEFFAGNIFDGIEEADVTGMKRITEWCSYRK